MADSWVTMKFNRIELENVKNNGVYDGAGVIVVYTPQEGAYVRVDGEEYRLEKGGKWNVTVIRNVVHIRTR
jgi:hypothetical protein